MFEILFNTCINPIAIGGRLHCGRNQSPPVSVTLCIVHPLRSSLSTARMTVLPTPMLLVPLLLLVLRNSSAFDNGMRMCSAGVNFDSLRQKLWLNVSAFDQFPSSSLLVCVKECLLLNQCQSFNFNLSNGMCQLNAEAGAVGTTEGFIRTSNTVFSNIADWPQRLAGVCGGHSCSANSVCTDVNGTATCVVSSCVGDSDFGKNTLIPIGTELTCGTMYFKTGDSVCTEGGTWVGNGTCVRLHSSCSSIASCNSTAEDGEYWLYSYHLQTSIRVYCANMNSGYPHEYITLNGPNYSNYTNFIIDADCSLGNADCGVTTFAKVELDMSNPNIRVMPNAFGNTYATASIGCPILEYGNAASCSEVPGCNPHAVGSFRIDTTGTGLLIDPEVRWASPQGDVKVTRSDDGRVVEGICHAACSVCFPLTVISFIADDYRPPPWSATASDAWNCAYFPPF